MAIYQALSQIDEPDHRESRLEAVRGLSASSDWTLFPLKPVQMVFVGLFAISITMNLLLLNAQQKDWDRACSNYTQLFDSPISDGVAIKYETVQFNRPLFHDNIYRGNPSPAVDQAWLELSTVNHHYIIPESQIERYGIDPGSVKVVPEEGGGYPVLFEFAHDLHCLNLIRKATWFNADYYFEKATGEFTAGRNFTEEHVKHCVDALRQTIMCQPDLGVYSQIWVADIDAPSLNFQTQHTCKNFDAIHKWVSEHQVQTTPKVRYRAGDLLLDTTL